MSQTVEVRFKGTRKEYFLWADGETPLRVGEAVLVEVERGRDLGRVHAVGRRRREEMRRRAARAARSAATRSRAEPAAAQAGGPPRHPRRPPGPRRESALGGGRAPQGHRAGARPTTCVMKVSDTEWQWDRNKLTIYFTAEKRVDFRALVRDLASLFRTRIELRQIGVRDEAARLSGVGRCGREYCCSSWLKELSPVNLGLAKDQHLSLNPSQISGGCGRLLCCLKYEHEFYVTARRRFPKEGKTVTGARGPERVDRGRHLPRAGLPAERGAGLPHHPAGPAPGRGRGARRGADDGRGPQPARRGGRAGCGRRRDGTRRGRAARG